MTIQILKAAINLNFDFMIQKVFLIIIFLTKLLSETDWLIGQKWS